MKNDRSKPLFSCDRGRSFLPARPPILPPPFGPFICPTVPPRTYKDLDGPIPGKPWPTDRAGLPWLPAGRGSPGDIHPGQHRRSLNGEFFSPRARRRRGPHPPPPPPSLRRQLRAPPRPMDEPVPPPPRPGRGLPEFLSERKSIADVAGVCSLTPAQPLLSGYFPHGGDFINRESTPQTG